jgi:hypothetical protein
LLIIFVPYISKAQFQEGEDETHTRDTSNNFCIRLSSIMLQAGSNFDKAKGQLLDSAGQKSWECNNDFKMKGARSSTIYQSGGKTTYVAFFISKESKEKLGSSYNNLYHQLKDCMGYNFVYHEKETSITDKLLGNVNYECEMEPHGDGIQEQAEMRVSVQHDSSGDYVLMLEIMKYTGYYLDRKAAVPH